MMDDATYDIHPLLHNTRNKIRYFEPNFFLDVSEAHKRRNNDLCSGGGTLGRGQLTARSSPSNVDDLIHLAGPLTEDAVLKTLQARFYSDEFFVSSLE